MFKQNLEAKPVRDFIFSVGNIVKTRFIIKGTAFFVGDQGVAVTAAHVIDDLSAAPDPIGMFTAGGPWTPIDIIAFEKHETEDIGLIKLKRKYKSICRIRSSWEGSSQEYDLWGYPERVAHELRAMAMTPKEAEHLIRPDLIFSRGYIRRRISRELSVSVYRGSAFYEISEVAGSCCSGAPLIDRKRQMGKPFEVFGVYIGEETGGALPNVGFATRCDAIADWTPRLTSCRLSELPVLE